MGSHQRILLSWLIFSLPFSAFAGTPFKSTTTLAAETGNNTSTAATFVNQSNGNLGAGNVSKVPMHSLLYSGSTAKVYVHLMPWFGPPDHMNVGYTSNDPAQAQRQINDMVSRGVDGAIIDWFGQGTLNHEFASYSQVVQDFRLDAEQQASFNFAIMDDAGSLKQCAATAGCDVTQTLINDLTYAYNNWENSPAYLHFNNQPVVYFFGQEAYTLLDWTRVRTSVPGNPLFIFRNAGGFSYPESNGGFSWVAPETVSATDPMALLYLANFDQTALSLSPVYSTESGYKGFNDSLASWGTGRLIQQQCSQTWLASLSESGKFYSTSKQMLGIQIATWNDYEEGTEIESGIDNCVTVTASASGTIVSWTITGQVNTLDHYTVFLSQDGENLMGLVDVPAGTNSLDLSQYQMNSGAYTVYVKAVGKPSIANHMSAGVNLTIPNQPPAAVLSVSPASGQAPLTVTASTAGSIDPDGTIAAVLINFGDGSAAVRAASATHTYNNPGTYNVTATITDNLGATSSKTASVSVGTAQAFVFFAPSNSASVAAGQATSYNLSLETRNSGFTGTVSLACNGAPTGVSCSVTPASVSFNPTTGSSPVTVTVATTQQAGLAPMLLRGLPLAFGGVLIGFFGSLGGNIRKRKQRLAGAALFLLCGFIGCGGGGGSITSSAQPAPRAPSNATLTIVGTSGSQTASVTLALTITH